MVTIARNAALKTWLVPLGLGHVDHKLVAQACRRLAAATPDRDWVVYEELPYAAKPADQVQVALSQLSGEGWAVEAIEAPEHTDERAKRELVACYASQLKALGDEVDSALSRAEKYYSLVRQNAA